MNNIVMLIGRLNNEIEIKNFEDNKQGAKLILESTRPYKNDNGEYEKDYIPVLIWNTIAESTQKYCKKGSLIGVKGSLEIRDNELVVNANKLTFLSSNKDIVNKEEE